MQWLLKLLNEDFLSGAAIPAMDHLSDSQKETVKQWIANDLAEGRITQEQANDRLASLNDPRAVMDEAERGEAARLQARIVHHLTPVLGLDPHDLVALRRKTMRLLLRQAERRGKPSEARELRQQLAHEATNREATQQREREEGLHTIVGWLSEWAEGEERLYPWWQIETPLTVDIARVPADQQYRVGPKVFTVTQRSGRPNTLTAKGMMNLGACLVSGELNRLRVCIDEACGRYFYAEDLRREHCSDACRRRKDGPKAAFRVKRWRRKQRTNDETLKRDALAALPKLHIRMLRDLAKRQVLNEREVGILDGLREKLEDGTPPARIWQRSWPRVRGVFRKLQTARAL